MNRADPQAAAAPAPPASVPPTTDHLVGLALSGGGIRSATFALGGLQALHKLELLPIFDYLSTVSGGGFTGGWWSAWLSRPERVRTARFPDGEDIEPNRRPSTLLTERAQTAPGPSAGGPGARDPIHHLRLFANYLTPRCGALSADTWRAVTFYVRSLIFNWLVLLPLLLALIMAGQLYYLAWDDDVAWGFVCSVPGDGEAPGDGLPSTICPRSPVSHFAVVLARLERAVAPLVILLAAMAALAILWLLHGTSTPWPALFGLLVLCGFSAYLVSTIRGSTSGSWWSVPGIALLAVAVVTLAHLWGLLATPRVGGRVPHDTHRTRLAQWNSRLLLTTVLLALVLGVAGFGHEIVWYFFYPRTGRAWSAVRLAGGWAAVVAAAASAGWTAYQAAPSGRAKDSAEAPGSLTRVAFMVAPYVVLGVLVLLLALAGRSVIVAVSGRPDVMRALSYGVIAGAVVQLVFAVSELWRRRRLPGLNHRALGLASLAIAGGGSQAWFLTRLETDSVAFILGPLTVTLILLAVAAVVGLGWMSDPNLLSMHSFYKARLVRAYLGASNPDRRGEQITESVPGDDVALRTLCNHDQGAPYHLVNTTLNLVASADLATAQRSAANFVLASYYCGSARTGYRLTEEYMGGELTLGTAVAISGAAASPNMGSRTPSMPLVMLLALVNARLGFWAPTPVGARWREPRAALWPFYLLREALSQTTDLTTYCYLTDGGHFDNTGLYALVERGCRYIALFDCGADPGPCFADLGGAIRRCRIDFGAEIDLGVQGLLDQTDGLATRQVVVGRVRYRKEHWDTLGLASQSDADRTGVIVWVKPAVTTADAADVRQYKLQNPVFPHQTTLDQWYDEAQFESYRKLGYDSVFSALRPCLPPPGPLGAGRVQALFQNLEKAYP